MIFEYTDVVKIQTELGYTTVKCSSTTTVQVNVLFTKPNRNFEGNNFGGHEIHFIVGFATALWTSTIGPS